jgi:Holliday junction DNA helicase RuvA
VRAVIAQLEGVLRERKPTRVVIGVGGVGYEVLVSLSTFAALPDEGKTVSLRVHTHVREDAIQLFGFHTELERGLFEQLIRVNGVGPRLAQAVLSGMAPRDLVAALGREDVAALCAIPGVGLKTAQRMLVDLRDRVGALAAALEPGAEPDPMPARETGDGRLEAITSALVNLGTARPRSERVAREVLEEKAGRDEPSLEALIRAALRRLAR